MADSLVRKCSPGDPVVVHVLFNNVWTGGFELVDVEDGGVRVRRRSDNVVLPALFDPHEVAPAE